MTTSERRDPEAVAAQVAARWERDQRSAASTQQRQYSVTFEVKLLASSPADALLKAGWRASGTGELAVRDKPQGGLPASGEFVEPQGDGEPGWRCAWKIGEKE